MKHLFALLLFLVAIVPLKADESERGFKLLSRNKPDKAYAEFVEGIKENPNCIGCQYGLALLISNKRDLHYDLEKAYKAIHKASELAKNKTQLSELQSLNFSKKDIKKLLDDVELELLDELKRVPDLDKLEKFRKSHPDLTNKDPLYTLMRELAFQKAESQNTVKAYTEFIDKYPHSDHVPRAIELRNLLSFNELLLKEKELLQKDSALKVAQLERQKARSEVEKERLMAEQVAQEREASARMMSLYVVLGFVVLILVLVGLAYRNKKKANELILQQKNEIEEQKENVQKANENIMDSINYAKFIQRAILPSSKKIKESFTDAFVFYKPKDVVSGDFYWFAEVNGKRIVAAVDCTGHGVPGAFMSMIGNTLLNQIVKVKQITDPSEILNELRSHVIKSLTQGEQHQDDGMDIALCVIDDKKVEFAGAFNPLIHIRDELSMIKGDRMPIGRHYKKEKISFMKHSIEIQPGDRLYIFSDGYMDQFGGFDNKKFTSKRFQKLLIEIHDLPGEEQAMRLEEEFNSWKGAYEQLDDILVIGLKV